MLRADHEVQTSTRFRPRDHNPLEHHHFSRWLKRWAQEREIPFWRDLFLLHHRQAGTYVLACWLQRPETSSTPCFREVMTVGPFHPQFADNSDDVRAFLRECFRPAWEQGREAARVRRDAMRRTEQLKKDEEQERNSAAHWFYKKGDKYTSDAIRSGKLPWVDPEIADAQAEAASLA